MSSPTVSTVRPAMIRVARTLSWLVVLTILVQAALSGPALFQSPGLFELHGFIGMATILFAAILFLATLLARLPVWIRIASVLMTAGSVAQTGLGYAGHRSGVTFASAVHVPLGVALLGLAVAIAVATHLLTSASQTR